VLDHARTPLGARVVARHRNVRARFVDEVGAGWVDGRSDGLEPLALLDYVRPLLLRGFEALLLSGDPKPRQRAADRVLIDAHPGLRLQTLGKLAAVRIRLLRHQLPQHPLARLRPLRRPSARAPLRLDRSCRPPQPHPPLQRRRANAEPRGHVLDRVVALLVGLDYSQPQVPVQWRRHGHLRGDQIMNTRAAEACSAAVAGSDRRSWIAVQQGSNRRSQRPDQPRRGAE